jgi:MFS family permease
MNRTAALRVALANLLRWFTVPRSAPEMNRRNFINVQIDAIGVGLASAANPFLPVFLTRLGASAFQVGLLTTMPAVTGLLLAIPLGQYLQTQRNIVPWFSRARLAVLSGYALTGLITIFLPEAFSVVGILGIWALVTIPQTVVAITFSVVMNMVAGPAGRYELMTHRWSILGLTNALTALVAGLALDSIRFPTNYQVVFMALSLGGLISYYFSSHIDLPDNLQKPARRALSAREQLQDYLHLIAQEKPFVSFILKRFVFLTGTVLIAPLLPIYYVRQLEASDSAIAFINIAANVTVILGYFFWTYQSRRRGSRLVLLATTFGVSLFPIMVGLTTRVWPVPIYAGIYGIFLAGLNLVLFDELMKRVPIEYSATFIAAAQSIQYLSSIVAPLIGTVLAGVIGTHLALVLGGVVSLAGFGLFLTEHYQAEPEPAYHSTPPQAPVEKTRPPDDGQTSVGGAEETNQA